MGGYIKETVTDIFSTFNILFRSPNESPLSRYTLIIYDIVYSIFAWLASIYALVVFKKDRHEKRIRTQRQNKKVNDNERIANGMKVDGDGDEKIMMKESYKIEIDLYDGEQKEKYPAR